jgi:hypothetical protein
MDNSAAAVRSVPIEDDRFIRLVTSDSLRAPEPGAEAVALWDITMAERPQRGTHHVSGRNAPQA